MYPSCSEESAVSVVRSRTARTRSASLEKWNHSLSVKGKKGKHRAGVPSVEYIRLCPWHTRGKTSDLIHIQWTAVRQGQNDENECGNERIEWGHRSNIGAVELRSNVRLGKRDKRKTQRGPRDTWEEPTPGGSTIRRNGQNTARFETHSTATLRLAL